MTPGMNIRVYRPGPVHLGMRQQVSSRSDELLPRRLHRPVAIVVVLGFVAALGAGQLMQWRTGSALRVMEQQQSRRVELGEENIRLLASRAKLASRQYVEAVAAVRFDLHAPGKNQVHRVKM
ncbi:hypothetical protein GF1_20720 [Desulfolithobacter dissulfuricans]|uniref:Uncharacterized protein n=2 Tax=Desulfolithobacter dissulfuricans TaxID=2795293 RepID=A0A915UA78_9BACT|nr:hypothetical protein GF1_20720 [Desulfolithobacter dissulfuricans]